MKLTISLGSADAEMVKFLSTLESGKLRPRFDSEVIHFKQLNEYYEKKGLQAIPPLYLSGSIINEFGIVFERKEIGDDLIRFSLDHSLYGSLGVLWLRTAGDTYSDLDYEAPPLPRVEEARKLLQSFPKGNSFIYKISDKDLEFGLRTETFEPAHLHVRRKNLQQDILQAFLESVQTSFGATIYEGLNGSTREFMVHLALRDTLTEVNSVIEDYEADGKLVFSRFTVPEKVFYFEISHHILGDIGKLSLIFKLRNFTKIQITPPPYPSKKEAEIAFRNSGLGMLPSGSNDHITWLILERTKENEKFFKGLYLRLRPEHDVPVPPTEQVAPGHERKKQPTKRKYAPNRQADFNKWVTVWKKIKPWMDKYGMQPAKLHDDLLHASRRGDYKGPLFETETIKKIIQAGEAGELETS